MPVPHGGLLKAGTHILTFVHETERVDVNVRMFCDQNEPTSISVPDDAIVHIQHRHGEFAVVGIVADAGRGDDPHAVPDEVGEEEAVREAEEEEEEESDDEKADDLDGDEVDPATVTEETATATALPDAPPQQYHTPVAESLGRDTGATVWFKLPHAALRRKVSGKLVREGGDSEMPGLGGHSDLSDVIAIGITVPVQAHVLTAAASHLSVEFANRYVPAWRPQVSMHAHLHSLHPWSLPLNFL